MEPWSILDHDGRRVGYARVSTKDQKLRLQRNWLQQMQCERVFADHGKSGKQSNRPALDQMMTYLKPGDVVIVWKLDRLGRSVDHLSSLLTHFKENGIHFCSISEGINTTTPGGKLIYHIISAVAEFQRDIIVENTVAGLEAAKDAGKTLGRPRKLNREQAANALELIKSGQLSKQSVAEKFGVSSMTLDRVIARTT